MKKIPTTIFIQLLRTEKVKKIKNNKNNAKKNTKKRENKTSYLNFI
jgi:hypothetical protein